MLGLRTDRSDDFIKKNFCYNFPTSSDHKTTQRVELTRRSEAKEKNGTASFYLKVMVTTKLPIAGNKR